MIKVMGTLKGVQLQSKLDTSDRTVHILTVKVELTEGHKDAQKIATHMKEIMELNLEPRQPKLLD